MNTSGFAGLGWMLATIRDAMSMVAGVITNSSIVVYYDPNQSKTRGGINCINAVGFNNRGYYYATRLLILEMLCI